MAPEATHADFYPDLGTYGVLGDGHKAALVSRVGSVDFEAVDQAYLEDTMVLRTELAGSTGRVAVVDALLSLGDPDSEARCLLRHLECLDGDVADNDPRMVGTVDAIRSELGVDGLLYRQTASRGVEGAFLACSFWLVECLVRQGRIEEAEQVFERAAATANHVGVIPEEGDPLRGKPLGNLPQGLTHYSHIAAAMALHATNERSAEWAPRSVSSSSSV